MGPNGIDFSAKNKAKLLVNTYEDQSSPNDDQNIPEVNVSVHFIRNSSISHGHLPTQKATSADKILKIALKRLSIKALYKAL